MEIRENYINIYYRGGNLIRLKEKDGMYSAYFDRNYIRNTKFTHLPDQIGNQELTSIIEVYAWIDAVPFMKQEMDC